MKGGVITIFSEWVSTGFGIVSAISRRVARLPCVCGMCRGDCGTCLGDCSD